MGGFIAFSHEKRPFNIARMVYRFVILAYGLKMPVYAHAVD